MIRGFVKALLIVSIGALTACSTQGHFVVPEGSKLYLGGRPEPVTVEADGLVTTKPFGWDAMGLPPHNGISYVIEKDGKVVKQGKLRTVFRGASLFWPPVYGIIARPTGLNPHLTYNLVTGEQK